MEEVEIWIARDKDGSLYVYTLEPPFKNLTSKAWDCFDKVIPISDLLFPSIQWEDKEPTKAKITLIK